MRRKIPFFAVLLLAFLLSPFGLKFTEASGNPFPAKYDLRAENKMTPVREQGELGSCWAIAATDALESHLKTTEKVAYRFSVNNMLTQLSSYYADGYKRNYQDGGDDALSAGYYAAWRGPVLEKEDPYSLMDKGDQASVITGLKPVKHVQEIIFIPERKSPLDNDVIKEHVMKYGAVTAPMWKGTPQTFGKFYNQDKYAWYYPYDYMNKEGNGHEVAIVGWDDSFSKENFAIKPPGDGAFLVKNTKGPLWGREDRSSNMEGYFYISYYDMMLASKLDSNVGSSVFTRVDPVTNYDNIYQYDVLGYTKSFVSNSKEAAFANVFFIGKGYHERLSAVSFYTLNENVRYEIWISNEFYGISSLSSLSKLAEGIIKLPGYHTIDLPKERDLPSNKKIAVVVKLFGSSENPSIALQSPDGAIKCSVSSNSDESYIYDFGKGSWVDLASKVKNSNVCLKIFTRNRNEQSDQITPDKMKQDLDFLVKWIKDHHPVVKTQGYSKQQQQIIDALYQKIQKPLRKDDYYLGINRMYTMLGDAHNILDYQSDTNKFLNLFFKWLEEGLVVDRNEGNYKTGDYILSIGGKTPEELNSRLYELMGSENDYWIRANGERLLSSRLNLKYLELMNDDATVDIKILRDGKVYIFRENFKAFGKPYRNYDKEVLWFTEKENNLGYFRFDEFASGAALNVINKNMDKFFQEVAQHKISNIAIDLRYNGGGTAGALHYLCRYLDYNTFYGEGKMNYEMDHTYPKADEALIFHGNVYVMTSNETFSCAVFAAGLLKDNGIVKTIGEPTGENPAFSRHMESADGVLPGSGWKFMMVGYKPQRPYYKDVNEKSIFPDVPVYQTRADLLTGRDMVMEKMRQLSRENNCTYYAKPLYITPGDNIAVYAGNKLSLGTDNKIYVPDEKKAFSKYNIFLEDTATYTRIPIEARINKDHISAELPNTLKAGVRYNFIIDMGGKSYCYLLYLKDLIIIQNRISADSFNVIKSYLSSAYKPWNGGLVSITFNNQVSDKVDISKIYFFDKNGNKIPAARTLLADDSTLYVFPATSFVEGASYKIIIEGGAFTSVDGEVNEEKIEAGFAAKY